MSNMNRIVAFARRVETNVIFGGCPVDRLFMTDTLSYSDIHIVDMGDEFNEVVNAADTVYKLRVEVAMRRARNGCESKWRWEPNKYGHAMLMFYHTDFDELLKYVADYLEAHHDPLPGMYNAWGSSCKRKPTFIKCIKHPRIGRIIHISEDPDYDSYKLEAIVD